MVTKNVNAWVLMGVCSTSGNIMTFWGTNFNMPVPCLFDGSSDCLNGWMAARYCDISNMSMCLGSLCAGNEVAVADGVFRWCTGAGECLNGIACVRVAWCDSSRNFGENAFQSCVDQPEFYVTWTENMMGIGIAPWEICCNGNHCTVQKADCVSGDDLSIGACTNNFSFACVPPTVQCNFPGKIWVEGNNLHYWNANWWEHQITGTCISGPLTAAEVGKMWLDNSHNLHWIGTDCNNYQAPWCICQFCSTFGNGPPANPSPGASCKGMIWVDNEFGWTHLSYIGCDGNKYLTGGGSYPYIAP